VNTLALRRWCYWSKLISF